MGALGIIPARAGSKRLAGKNLRLLGGKPLVARVIDAALGAKRLSRIVVSSDDPQVLELARGVPGVLALDRPEALARDDSPAIEYVRHALHALEVLRGEPRFDVVVILPPAAPFTVAEDIDGTLGLLERTGADTAVSVVELDHAIHPVKLKRLVGDRLLPYLEEERGRMAYQELPKLYVRNTCVYATRRGVVDAGEIIGADCRGYVMPRERSIDINDPLDLAFAEFLLARAAGR